MAKSVQKCQPKSSTLAVNMHPMKAPSFRAGVYCLIVPTLVETISRVIYILRVPGIWALQHHITSRATSTDVLKGYASHRNHCKRLYGGLGGLSREQHTGTFVSVLPQRPIAAEIELVKAHPSIVNS